MASVATTVRLEESLMEALDLYCVRTGATKNGAVVAALSEFLGRGPEAHRGGGRVTANVLAAPTGLWPSRPEVEPDYEPFEETP